MSVIDSPPKERLKTKGQSMEAGHTHSGNGVELNCAQVATSGSAILAMRGAGKSWLNAVLAEGLIRNGFPVVMIDPEGEYWTLKVAFGNVVVAGGEHADVPLAEEIGKELARIAVEETIPLVIDLSEMRRHEQFFFLSVFLGELFFLETTHRIPLWVSFEEADLWVPQKTNTQCKNAVLDICQRGRKRGLGFSLVSQRPATLDKTALSQAEFRFFKRFQQPHDLTAVAEYLGSFSQLASRLPQMARNESLFYAPTLSDSPIDLLVRARASPHGGATPEQVAQIKSSPAISSLRQRLESLVQKRRQEMSIIESQRNQISSLESQLNQKVKELEKLQSALELAAIMNPRQSNALSTRTGESRVSEFEVHGVDPMTGIVRGNLLAELLFNKLSIEERAVLLRVLESKRPVNVQDLLPLVDFGRSKLTQSLSRLERKGIIQRAKGRRRGKFYIGKKLT